MAEGAFSWKGELSSGRSPFWIRDEGLSGLGLHPGDPVSVDTRIEPRDGDLVVVEAEIDGDSQRLARRYFAAGPQVRLEPVGDLGEVVELEPEQLIVMGVIVARVRFPSAAGGPPIEDPLNA